MRVGAAARLLLLGLLLAPAAAAQASGYTLTLVEASLDHDAPLVPDVGVATLQTVARVECSGSGRSAVPPRGWYLQVEAGSGSTGIGLGGDERVPISTPDCVTDQARELVLHHAVRASERAPALTPIMLTVHAQLLNSFLPAPPTAEGSASAFVTVAYVGRLGIATGAPEERGGAVHVPVHVENLGNLPTVVRVVSPDGEAAWAGAEPVLETKATGGTDTVADGTVVVRGAGRGFTLHFVPVAAAHPEHQGDAVQSRVGLSAAAPPSPGATPALIALVLTGSVAALGLRRPRV